jgi:hypothetical protein
MHQPEYLFEDCFISADLWEVFDEFLSPTAEVVDMIINDWDVMIMKSSEDDGPLGVIAIYRDLVADTFQCALIVSTESPSNSKTPGQMITLSFLNSDLVYLLEPEVLLDKYAIKEMVIKFLDGDDLLQSISFQTSNKETLANMDAVFVQCITEENSKLPTDE